MPVVQRETILETLLVAGTRPRLVLVDVGCDVVSAAHVPD